MFSSVTFYPGSPHLATVTQQTHTQTRAHKPGKKEGREGQGGEMRKAKQREDNLSASAGVPQRVVFPKKKTLAHFQDLDQFLLTSLDCLLSQDRPKNEKKRKEKKGSCLFSQRI